MSDLSSIARRIRRAPRPGERGGGSLRFVASEGAARVAASHPDAIKLLCDLWNAREGIAALIEHFAMQEEKPILDKIRYHQEMAWRLSEQWAGGPTGGIIIDGDGKIKIERRDEKITPADQ